MSLPPGIFPMRSEFPLLSTEVSTEAFFKMCVDGCRMIACMDNDIQAPIVNILTKDGEKFYDNMLVMARVPERLRPLIVKAVVRKMNAVACVVVQNPKSEGGEEYLTFSMQTLAETKFKAYRVYREPEFGFELDEELEQPIEDAGAWAGLMLPPMAYEEA